MRQRFYRAPTEIFLLRNSNAGAALLRRSNRMADVFSPVFALMGNAPGRTGSIDVDPADVDVCRLFRRADRLLRGPQAIVCGPLPLFDDGLESDRAVLFRTGMAAQAAVGASSNAYVKI